MKKHFLPLLAIFTAVLMSSCASGVEKRIAHNPQIYQALTEGHKRLVSSGQVTEGMSKEAVFLAWGRPDRSSKGSKQGKSFERWSYRGYEPVHSTSFGYGYGGGWGPYGYYYHPVMVYEPTVTYLPFEARRVDFSSNKVTAWSVTPR